MNEEIGRKIAIARLRAVAEEANPVLDSQAPGQLFKPLRLWGAEHQETEAAAADLCRTEELDCVQQRLDPFEPVVHGHEKADSFARSDAPTLPPLEAPAR